MLRIKSILKNYSNDKIAAVTGYPVNHIRLLRKNDVDEFAIRTDKTGRGIPTKSVFEKRIIEKFEAYEAQKVFV